MCELHERGDEIRMEEKQKNKEDGASALKKGLAILSSFSWTKNAMTLTEIARERNFPLPTAARLIKALEEEGFLERNTKTKRFHLGFKCSLLGAIAKKTGILRMIASPYMEELRSMFNETVNLYLREGDIRVCYEQIESSFNLKRSAKLGDRFPLWAGAAGRCFLAFMKREEIDRILEEVEPLTANTILDKDQIYKKSLEVKTRGYSFSVSEREEGVSSVAAPIFDASMQTMACLTVSGPTSRFSEEMIAALIPEIKQRCFLISLKLGAERKNLTILETEEPVA